MKQAEFARREAELQPALTRELAAFRIFVSNDLPKRERCRIEGAIIRRLAADGAPLPDVGMLMHRTAAHEAPITVVNACERKVIGLPKRLLLEGQAGQLAA